MLMILVWKQTMTSLLFSSQLYWMKKLSHDHGLEAKHDKLIQQSNKSGECLDEKTLLHDQGLEESRQAFYSTPPVLHLADGWILPIVISHDAYILNSDTILKYENSVMIQKTTTHPAV